MWRLTHMIHTGCRNILIDRLIGVRERKWERGLKDGEKKRVERENERERDR